MRVIDFPYCFEGDEANRGRRLGLRILALILVPPLIILAMLFGSSVSSSQEVVTSSATISGSQANWFFGFFGELQFNTGEALPGNAALNNHTIFSSEASITQSDANGNLQFYSDGRMIWNNLHALVSGGLNGGTHPAQALSIPDPADQNPGNPSSFYLISMRGYVPFPTTTDGNFGYTKVSVSGSDVTLSELNTPIAPPSGADTRIAEMVTAVPGCGSNYWIIVHGSYLDPTPVLRHALFVYPLTAAGIGAPTVYSIVGPALFGQLKASPNGTRIAYGTGDDRSADESNLGHTYVLDFNRNTGALSNPLVIDRYAYGVSFSPNSQLLYLTESVSGLQNIFQYDLSTADVNGSEELVAEVTETYSALQLGPDNKIYVALNGNNHLAVINFPDERNGGSVPNACGYNFDGPFLNIPSGSTAVTSGFGLPNMIDAQKASLPLPADCCPAITLNPAVGVLPGGVVGTPYSQIFAAMGGIGAYNFMVSSGTLPPGMALDANGMLQGNPITPGTYTFTVRAADVNGCLGLRQYQIIVSCPPIFVILAIELPDAVANTPYSQTLTVTGDTGPHTFAVSNGSLPPGLVLNADGTLHGTPVTLGTYAFTVTTADVNLCPGARHYQIIVSCPAITLSPPAGALTGAVANTPYSQTFMATGGCASFTYGLTSGALPPGITLGTNGMLSGTATQPGDFTFTVMATDSCSCSHSQTYTLKVHGPLVISRFRENGPAGAGDEFVEIFNPSSSAHTVVSANGSGYGVFASAGNGTTSNDLSLACRIPEGTVIQARGYFLCAGTSYSLGNLGRNGGVAGATAVGDAATLVDIPNDAGLALYDVSALTASNVSVFDKVGFVPYGPGAPAPAFPSIASFFCEGMCLQPVGDASVLGTCTDPSGLFPVIAAGPACYGQSGQYEFLRRQTAFDPSVGTLHRDTGNNADDFILVSPNAATNLGQSITGISGITSVLGAAGPHNSSAPRDTPFISLTQAPFDVGSQLGPRNAQRNYGFDPSITNSANNPQGTFSLRFRFTNNSGNNIMGLRFRLDNASTLCGPLTATPTVGTGNARNLSSSDCGTGSFTAILKLLNSAKEVVVDGSGTGWLVHGTVLEDLSATLSSPAQSGTGPLSPLGGGVDNSIIVGHTDSDGIIGHADNAGFVGDGVTGGVGSFATTMGTSGPTQVLRVNVKFGVVRSGRFILLITAMAKTSPTP